MGDSIKLFNESNISINSYKPDEAADNRFHRLKCHEQYVIRKTVTIHVKDQLLRHIVDIAVSEVVKNKHTKWFIASAFDCPVNCSNILLFFIMTEEQTLIIVISNYLMGIRTSKFYQTTETKQNAYWIWPKLVHTQISGEKSFIFKYLPDADFSCFTTRDFHHLFRWCATNSK